MYIYINCRGLYPGWSECLNHPKASLPRGGYGLEKIKINEKRRRPEAKARMQSSRVVQSTVLKIAGCIGSGGGGGGEGARGNGAGGRQGDGSREANGKRGWRAEAEAATVENDGLRGRALARVCLHCGREHITRSSRWPIADDNDENDDDYKHRIHSYLCLYRNSASRSLIRTDKTLWFRNDDEASRIQWKQQKINK